MNKFTHQLHKHKYVHPLLYSQVPESSFFQHINKDSHKQHDAVAWDAVAAEYTGLLQHPIDHTEQSDVEEESEEIMDTTEIQQV